ncbi:MAG TPA: PhzF family phenazine biosynthesis protein [Candidatus Marinimicrobia bacterium]|nr:PhzF family phenazine biosynthesis protein [Candidatus Neomarinimicrobiota bacterium]HIB96227.1 PhzF family phenazine biosynthesis protein [Candidatus Neomarinimicrobiota bacterium]HIO74977.1 PhzF family phenazine biosynthesis protein [Candidatus Neomarinimicrobiota bacterium]
MMLPIYQVDAFASELFRGNPAAVVPLEEWLPDTVLLSIALENNLSETAYLVPDRNGYHIRWFTPVVEVALCGHATLASAHVVFSELGFDGETIEFQSKSGPLTVKCGGSGYIMDFPAEPSDSCDVPKPLTEGLGLEPDLVMKGTDYLAVVSTQLQIEKLAPDFRKLARLKSRGLIVTAPGDDCDFVSRCFFPQTGIDEDPVTGSAHCQMTPYWVDRLGKSKLVARQLSARGGEVICKMQGDRVLLEGQAVKYLEGKIEIPL